MKIGILENSCHHELSSFLRHEDFSDETDSNTNRELPILHVMEHMNIFRICKKWANVAQMTNVAGNKSLWVKDLFKVQKRPGILT